MRKNLFVNLLLLLVVLGIAFYLADSGNSKYNQPKEEHLFGKIKAEDIAKIEIAKGQDTVVLERKEGIWGLPAKKDYPADFSKVQSFVLKVLDERVSQVVTENPSNYADLGVVDEMVASGTTRIVFWNSANGVLGKAYLGDLRKVNSNTGVPTPSGQYVKNDASAKVYLVSPPVAVFSKATDWLNSSVADVLRSRVYDIRQYVVRGGNEELAFEIVRSGKAEQSDSKDVFVLKNAPAKGKSTEENFSAILQVASGLENLRFSEVYNANDESKKSLDFNARTVYRLKDGSVYTLDSASRGNKIFVKASVTLDSALMNELKDVEQSIAAERAAVAAGADAAKEAAVVSKVSYADESSTKLLNDALAPWIFEFPKYVESKFRQTKPQLSE